jgi:hypothetical protein
MSSLPFRVVGVLRKPNKTGTGTSQQRSCAALRRTGSEPVPVLLGVVGCLAVFAAAGLVAAVELQAAEPARGLADGPVDIAAFARVVTSDAKRMTGTAASRLQEFPAADITLETELRAAADGSYAVPATADAAGCIGLRWQEMRLLRRLELQWGKGVTPPSADAVKLQYWVGESPWQGEWKRLPGKFTSSGDVWSWQIADADQPVATVRVRWVFPASKTPLVVQRVSAFGRLGWKTANLLVEFEQPTAGEKADVAIYNGALLTEREDGSKPMRLKVRYSEPAAHKGDCTTLRCHLPERTVCVAVEDVVARGCVYVPSTGLFVTTDPPRVTLAQYRQEIAGKKKVLDEVRQMPDQTFSQAMAITHNPIQNLGPMLVSLACDNRKFIVERNGVVHFRLFDAPDTILADGLTQWDSPPFHLVPQLGDGKGEVKRHLDGEWLPKHVTTVTQNGLECQERFFVAPLDEKAPDGCPSWFRQRAVGVAEFTIKNTLATEANVSLAMALSKDGEKTMQGSLEKVKEGLLFVREGRVAAFFDAGQSPPLQLAGKENVVTATGKLAAGKSAKLVVYLPAWLVKPADYAVFGDSGGLASQTDRYWTSLFDGTMQIDIPDRFLANVIRASQVHCLLAARNEDRGRRVAPWIASVVYGPLESEAQAVIRGMDLCGHADFARRGLEFFLKRYNQQGFLTTGYTVVGTGEHLWTLAEFYARQGDKEWLKQQSPTLARACKWIVAQRAKTKRLDTHGQRVPEYGLFPPGVTADWNRFSYRLFNDIQYCRGLEDAARALADIGHPDAAALLADAKAYREDLQRACRGNRDRCPVVLLANGTWVPNYSGMLDCLGNIEQFVPSEDANRTWCYSIEIGMHQLAANHLVDPRCDDVTEMVDYMEDHQFLRDGWFDYPEQRNRTNVFCFGGFSKVQPYYCRIAEVYALRDEVKPFVRSYFNALAAMLSAENLSLWEHFHDSGAWNKTHETGWFLCQTATMFVLDRDDELWLAPMATDRWLQDGMKIEVRNAPTRFGRVSYKITSAVGDGHIDAEIQPPTRGTPKQLVIRLRHPEGKPIKAVTVNGKPHQEFDAGKEIVRIAPTTERVTLRAEY